MGCGKVGADPGRRRWPACRESEFVAVCDADLRACRGLRQPVRRAAVRRRGDDARGTAACRGRLRLHAPPASRPAGDPGGRGRSARAGGEAAGGEPRRLRRHDRRRPATRGQARGHQPAAVVRAGPRMKRPSTPARSAGPCWASFTMYSWRDEAYYRSDPWRGKWDTEGGGVLDQPVAPHARPAPLADGRPGRRGQRLLGEPQPSLR